MLSGRNQIGLTGREIAACIRVWELLCRPKQRVLVVTEAARHSSRTRFNEADGKVYLGADVFPGPGVGANHRLSMMACLAHELAHAERAELEFERPLSWPDNLRDEAETSLHASFHPDLSDRDRTDLVEDANERLIEWLAQNRTEVNL
ncbi:MAG: hypothetical protein HOP19_14560 [Acidobacteria bacterium]|nr:hypothetical protein [Acidobacteriota bacterium]